MYVLRYHGHDGSFLSVHVGGDHHPLFLRPVRALRARLIFLQGLSLAASAPPPRQRLAGCGGNAALAVVRVRVLQGPHAVVHVTLCCCSAKKNVRSVPP